ncbi:uncharacterized protein LOC124119161 [Haliotis rufescens]|uniref:uncharacterized protein LOC124119161 n=1 Tax=Haliotis rufescens TaxID=6454 RepID=UPI00201F8E43|nr:uncharacterized protein LOC124119161 [Haliotis rufescens]
MFEFGVIALLLVCLPETVADTCTACKTAYGTAKGNATDNAAKCAAIVTYLHCLEGSRKDEAGCPLPKADSDAIETDYAAAACNASFTDTCICQKDFWATDVGTNDAAAVCSATTAYIVCLKGKTNAACDGSNTVVALATGVGTRITNLGSSCTVTSACQCEINAAKADISTDAKKCTVLTTLKTCLSAINTTTEAGCTATTQEDLLTDTNTKITAATCGAVADHATFAMTSLIVSVLVNMFL